MVFLNVGEFPPSSSQAELFPVPLQQGPDYRLYKSEPELTTVTEVDENNGEDRSEHPPETPGNKGAFKKNIKALQH